MLCCEPADFPVFSFSVFRPLPCSHTVLQQTSTFFLLALTVTGFPQHNAVSHSTIICARENRKSILKMYKFSLI